MLKKLLESRDKLRDLLSAADLSENLETVLEGILSDADAVRRLAAELGQDGSSATITE
jgi:type VI secretion system protein ImpB